MFFFFLASEQTGQLNEYTERKEMSSSVVCMALGRVPAGELRSRFLAVGLSDNTVRIISLDPNVSNRLKGEKNILKLFQVGQSFLEYKIFEHGKQHFINFFFYTEICTNHLFS